MIIWVRNFVLIFAVLMVLYMVLSIYFTARHRLRLRDMHKARERQEPEDQFIAQEMEGYRKSLQVKLILAIFFLPFALIGLLIYLANYA